MARTPLTKAKKTILLILAFMALVSSVVVSIAVFTDRVNRTTTIQISSFDDDGYSIERTAPEGYFIAGQTLDVTLKESNSKSESITSQITMTVAWDSPVADIYPWGNDNAGNAVIKLGNTEITYTVNADHTITFTLPETSLTASGTATNHLTFQIPDDLASTGTLQFNFDRIELGYASWSVDYDNTKLDALDFSVDVAWNISKTQTNSVTGTPNLDVIAVLQDEDNDGKYELEIIKNGSDSNTNNGQMMDWTAKDQTPWADFAIEDISIEDGVTTIGDYALAGETGITSVDLPDTITHIGTSAFDGSGLTGELLIPASVEEIETLGFGNLPNVTTITFEHGSDDTLILPDNESEGEGSSGAFYVPSYVPTTINTENEDIAHEYNWHNDHRKAVPTLASQNTWYQGTTAQNTITSITILDYYDPATILTEPAWDASEAKDGSVMAYVVSDGSGGNKLIIAGNGYGSIYANVDSTYAFGAADSASADAFSKVSTISGLNLLDTSKTTTMNSMFKGCSSVVSLDISHFDTRKVTDMNSMFCDCSAMTTLDISDESVTLNNNTYTSWDTSGVTDMANQFSGCSKLAALDVSHFDTSAVTDTNHMFYNCAALTTLDVDGFDTRAVEDMSFMFAGCESLASLDVGSFDTQKVTTTESMFMNCYVLPELDVKKESVTLNGRTFTAWDTGEVTTMAAMFENCQALGTTDLSSWDATSVTTMYRMFYNCYAMPSINLTNFSTSNALKNMGSTFYQCQTLTSVDLSSFTTSGLEDMSSTFFSCYKLTGVDFGSSFDANAVTTIRSMFAYCSGLTTFDFSAFHTSSALQNMYMLFSNCTSLQSVDLANFDTSGVTNMSQLFYKCSKLLELDLTMFDTAKVTSTSGTFAECPVLHTIYVSYDWSNESNTYSTSMFSNNYDLVGGAGTVYSSNYTDATRALIDGSGGKKGYFTNNIFLSYEDVTVGETVAADLTIKSKVFDDYVTSYYTVTSGSAYASVNSSTGLVTGKAKGTATVQVTLTATNGDTITAEADVNVLAISVTHANLSYDDVYVGSTVEADLDIYPTNHGDCQSIEYEVISGDEYAKVDPDTGNVTGLAKGSAVIQVTIVDGNGKIVTTTGDVDVLAISVTYAELSYDDVYVGSTVEADLDIYPTNHGDCQSIEFEVISGGEYAEVDEESGIVTGLAEGTAVIQVTIVDGNGKTVTDTATVNVLPISITSATLTYADVYVGSTVNPGLIIYPTNNGGYKSMTYAVTEGSTYASVNSSTGVVTGEAKGTAKVTVTIVDKNNNTITATGTVNVLPISITSATLTYADVYVGSTVNPGLTIYPENNGGYKSMTYTVTEGSSYASVNSSTGVVTGKAKGTAKITVTIVDYNNNTIMATGTVNVLAVSITSATLTYADVYVGSTVDPNLTLTPTNNGGYKSKTYTITEGSTYASVNSSTGVVTGKAKGTAKVTVTIVDYNDNTITATGTVNVLPISITSATLTYADVYVGSTVNPGLIIYPTNNGGYKSMTYTVTEGSTYASVNSSTGVVTGEAKGTAKVTVTIVDNNNNTITATGTVNVLPISITSATLTYADVYVDSTVNPGLTIYPENNGGYKSMTYAITEGSSYASVNSSTGVVTGEAKGTAKVTVTIVDNNNNTITATGTVNVLPISITSATLTYADVYVGSTVNPGLTINPSNHGGYQSIEYVVLSGDDYAKVDKDTGTVTGLAKGTATIQVTIVDNNNNTITTTGTVNVLTAIPVLAASNKWYTQGDTAISRTAYTGIALVDSYSPTGTVVESWDASDGEVGTVTAYVESDGSGNGTYKLTIAGNGYGSIYANKNSSFAFSKSSDALGFFENVTSISGLDIMDTSNTTNMEAMFHSCESLLSLDVSTWDTSNVKYMNRMFSYCRALIDLDVSTKRITMNGRTYDSWDTGSNTTMLRMFGYCNALPSLDVSHFDTSGVTTMEEALFNCTVLETLNIATSSYTLNGRTFDSWDTGSVTCMKSMFGVNNKITSLDVSHFDTHSATNLTHMFNNCSLLASINVSSKSMTMNGRTFDSWDTGNAVIMTCMFSNLKSLTSLDVSHFDTSSVTTTTGMFSNCFVLTDLDISTEQVTLNGRTYDSWDTVVVTTMDEMFLLCKALPSLDVSHFDTGNVTDMESMFYCCISLPTIELNAKSVTMNGRSFTSWQTGAVTDMSTMFYACDLLSSLDLSHFDTSAVTDMYGMFYGCSSLYTLDVRNFDTGNVTDMAQMFMSCLILPEVNLSSFDTSSVTDMSQMFAYSESLTSITLSSNFKTSNVTDMSQMFNGCSALISLDLSSFDTSSIASAAGINGVCYNTPSLTSIILSENFIADASLLPVVSDGEAPGLFRAIAFSVVDTAVYNANEIMKGYDWEADNRNVTFDPA